MRKRREKMRRRRMRKSNSRQGCPCCPISRDLEVRGSNQ
jgi:hypothetical protein